LAHSRSHSDPAKTITTGAFRGAESLTLFSDVAIVYSCSEISLRSVNEWHEACKSGALTRAGVAAREAQLGNDKVFTAYALLLIAGVASVITASVLAGTASLPTPVSFLEHLALSLGFRAAYKGIGGFSWDEWSLMGDRVAEATPTAQPTPEPTITRKAA